MLFNPRKVNLLVQREEKSYILGKDFFLIDMNITQTCQRHGKHFQILNFATQSVSIPEIEWINQIDITYQPIQKSIFKNYRA